jgi:hypothetical protein
VLTERRQNDLAELSRDGVILGQLLILLHRGGLRPRSYAAVDPRSLVEALPRMAYLFECQDIGNRQKHGRAPSLVSTGS